MLEAEHGEVPPAGLLAPNLLMPGRYSFSLPDLPGGLRPLRDPDAVDED
jgi:hypothetical protein